jgi:GAG-pre-integrase domain
MKNLISLSRLMADNSSLILEFSSSCFVKDSRIKTTLLQVSSSNGLFSFPPFFFSPSPQAYIGIRASADVWHARLGHPSTSTTLDVITVHALPCASNKLSLCQPCYMAKAHKLPFCNSLSTTTTLLELVHSNIWSPSPIISYNDFRYYLLLVDDYSKYFWIYFMKQKSEVPYLFSLFKQKVETMLSSKIKIL